MGNINELEMGGCLGDCGVKGVLCCVNCEIFCKAVILLEAATTALLPGQVSIIKEAKETMLLEGLLVLKLEGALRVLR